MGIKYSIPLSSAINFENDIREHVLAKLPHKQKDADALKAMKTRQLLIIYENWRERFISQRPRTVHISVKLNANPLIGQGEFSGVLEEICERIKNGCDLNPHLSKGVLDGYKTTTETDGQTRITGLDLMLNDWSIHHLHLSMTLGEGSFTCRTRPLLFVVFKPDDAYLIDIAHHSAWTSKSLIGTVIDEWPNKGIVVEQAGVILSEHSYSETELQELRNAGISARIEHNGKVYYPPGITTAGTSNMSTAKAAKILRRAQCFKRNVEGDPEWFPTRLIDSAIRLPSSFRFKFVFDRDGYVAFEENSTAIYRLDY